MKQAFNGLAFESLFTLEKTAGRANTSDKSLAGRRAKMNLHRAIAAQPFCDQRKSLRGQEFANELDVHGSHIVSGV